MLFDERFAAPMFRVVHRGLLRQPSAFNGQYLRDVDVIREFFTGAGLIAFCDLPWFPVYVGVSYIMHPWFAGIAIIGGIVTLFLALLNEFMTRKTLLAASKANMTAGNSAGAAFRNIEVVHAMGMLEAMVGRWSQHHREVLGLQAEASDRAGAIIAFTKFFRMFLQTGILGLGAYLAVVHEISAGTMIAASIVIGRALQPIEIAVGNWKSFLAAREAFGRMKLLFHAVGVEPERMRLPSSKGLSYRRKHRCRGAGRQDADFEGHLLQTWGGRTSWHRGSERGGQVEPCSRFGWGVASGRRSCAPGWI